MSDKLHYKYSGSYGSTNLIEIKLIDSKLFNKQISCWLECYSHIWVDANVPSEEHSIYFYCRLIKSVGEEVGLRFNTLIHAKQYYDTLTSDNIDLRYVDALNAYREDPFSFPNGCTGIEF